MGESVDIRRLSQGRSFWREAYDRVLRDRLALVGLALIGFIVAIAVWTPLIAVDKPYRIEAVFADDYENAYFVWLDSHEQFLAALQARPPDLERVRRFAGLIPKALDDMKRSLPPGKADALDAERAAYAPLLERALASASDIDEGTLRSLSARLEAIEAPFDPFSVTLVPQVRWPAFRALNGIEVAFMVWWAGSLIAYLWRRLRFHLSAYAVAVALAVVTGVGWRLAFPPVFDSTPYRDLVERETNPADAVLPPVFFGENENLTEEAGLPPTWWRLTPEQQARARHTHWMGTDDLGKDVLCRMIYGARVSMIIGLVAVSIYVAIGIVLGALAGYFGGWADIAVSRAIEVMMCFPVFFLILAIVAYARPSIITIMVVLGVTGWTGTARLQRGEFMRLVSQDYVQAVRALGGSHLRIIFRHILPNGVAPILVVASFGIASAILTESALSYLGFGVPQPHASWGNLLNDGAGDIRRLWWLILFPGAAIFITITAWNLFGEVLRDALDPRLRD